MAAAEVIGRAGVDEAVTENKNLKSNGIDAKNVNGKIHHHKNGYVKSTHISNGVSVSKILFSFFCSTAMHFRCIICAK